MFSALESAAGLSPPCNVRNQPKEKENMSSKKSRLWSFALPLSVVFLAAVYYIKMPDVRKAVDARTPIARNLLGRFVQESGTRIIVSQGEQDPALLESRPAKKPAPAPPPRAPMVTRAPEPVTSPVEPVLPVAPSPAPAAGAPDLRTIASDRTKWPKQVVLVKPAKFPAVLNGKVVGSLTAPAGAMANLVSIKDDKLALEFNGGGAWIPADQTDLIARVQGGPQ